MTDEELIAWEKGEWDQGWWDKRMVSIRAQRGNYPDALMFLRADAELTRRGEIVEVADRWRKRKGHNDGHDCDLCNAIRRAKEGK